ncbi:hypothetical protein ACT29H_04550 [Thermophagus sp. OGC60D27]|uniref:hypothetical protein n=1 Tax=Thermophagus sp. OGC60D27 TaxID=3458415 RepID=UPI004037F9C3
MISRIIIVIFFAVFFFSCEENVDVPTPQKGTADFSVFVSLGDSYTAGYTNGALSADGQQSAFSSLLAQQLMKVGSEAYSIPMLPDGTSVGSSLKGEMVLKVTESGLSPQTTEGNPELLTDPFTWINSGAPYHNLGIPGAKSFHLIVPEYGDPTLGEGNFNPFYARFASNPGTSTALSDALMQNPTFFSLWIGGNDVLSYALAGGEGEAGGTESDDITTLGFFSQSINTLMAQMTSSGAGGVTATIPDIELLPFFNLIVPNALELSADQAEALNAAYADYNALALQFGLDEIAFSEGFNFFVIEDPLHALGRRQIKADEKILMTLPREKITTEGWGTQVAIPKEYVLDELELNNLSGATEDFNKIIRDGASQYGLAVVETNELLLKTFEGLIVDGVTYTNDYVTGGLFSLDGIHLTGRGSAIVANAFIDAINETYGSTVPHVVVNDQKGIVFP